MTASVQFLGTQILWEGSQIAMDPACCCFTLGCCTSVPTVLYATFANAGACACLAGTVVTLNWNNVDRWTGTAALGTCGEDVTVSVIFAGSAGSPCVLSLSVEVSFSNACSGPIITPATTFCDPISTVAIPLSGSAPNTCCGGGALLATVTITE